MRQPSVARWRADYDRQVIGQIGRNGRSDVAKKSRKKKARKKSAANHGKRPNS
jgi:hypothetical protein